MIHLGYLGYDFETEEAFIPNKEIIRKFERVVSVSGWSEVMHILKASEKLLQDTLHGDADSAVKGFDKAHTEMAPVLT